jgi:hypothetical protein
LVNKKIETQSYLCNDGLIIIVEDSNEVDDQNNALRAFKRMYNLIQLEVIPNTCEIASANDSLDDAFILNSYLDASLCELCQAIGQKINYDSQQIILWRVRAFGNKQPGHLYEDIERHNVIDYIQSYNSNFVHDPRVDRTYVVYYSRLPIPREDLNLYVHGKVLLMNHRMETKVTIYC